MYYLITVSNLLSNQLSASAAAAAAAAGVGNWFENVCCAPIDPLIESENLTWKIGRFFAVRGICCWDVWDEGKNTSERKCRTSVELWADILGN